MFINNGVKHWSYPPCIPGELKAIETVILGCLLCIAICIAIYTLIGQNESATFDKILALEQSLINFGKFSSSSNPPPTQSGGGDKFDCTQQQEVTPLRPVFNSSEV